ncbi:MAG: tRNA 2-thiouridine(34) synthase MnmA [Bacteroidaceae bacterium]|nr:tRNA 2-thiouridine(34) synthase MnmA [Paraprevotella sp.]MDY2716591.1 tRNA 2-thiouridine(34) synthase MnmA [Bacteroidaceae bacterium]MDD7241515.1 tRNA 2-thiouridine(34) synthase MnmA [Paraprevotella sp.]MDY3891522.1 tRNA 2-thiouridine(34) synthase MnmA [Bacteroidaceae bacterium]MDY5192667.1 tRNA 2-thiouridine(34) synthase MnmA [Bacteroidaceae bacterium]
MELQEIRGSVAVLISGGVDSAVVVHRLCEAGIKPDLHYIKIGMEGEDSSCTAEEDIELSQATARKYGLHLEVTDLQKEYWDLVVGYAVERVKQGLTPNPDVMCNRLIKFGAFEQRIGHSYDHIATGHYATNIWENDMMWLGTAIDPVKDQTDFLAQLSYDQLKHTIFPLGRLMKEEVRQIAIDAKLPSARRKDSQGICFLGKINYNDFLRRFMGEKEGKVIDIETGKVVGHHQGFWFHTIGQRKGLGLGGGPWFVVKKNIRKNIIFVAHGWDTQLQYGHDFRLADMHFITKNPWESPKELPIQFKIRHVDHFMPGTITLDEEGYHIHSEQPIQGIAPGQFGCIYDSEARICYGSGEISIYKER